MPAKKKPKAKPNDQNQEDEEEDEEVYVTFAMVRELLITQERLLKAHYQEMFSLTNRQIEMLTSKVEELRISIEFTQKDVTDLKAGDRNTAEMAKDADPNLKQRIEAIEAELKALKGKTVYLENQSRRNNIRIDGIPETTGETWDDVETKVKEVLSEQLNFSDEVKVERAHRSGRVKTPGLGRTIVCKLHDWKQKDKIIQMARKTKPPGLFINEDFSAETIQRRKEQIPELKRAKEQGKLAYFVVDKLVIKDRQFVRHEPIT